LAAPETSLMEVVPVAAWPEAKRRGCEVRAGLKQEGEDDSDNWQGCARGYSILS